jgi:hypothetical protein
MTLSVLFLACLCLATGILPGFWIPTLSEFLSLPEPEASNAVYTFSNLFVSLLTAAGGILVYLLLRRRAGLHLLGLIEDTTPGLDSSLLLLAGTLIAITFVGWIAAGVFPSITLPLR